MVLEHIYFAMTNSLGNLLEVILQLVQLRTWLDGFIKLKDKSINQLTYMVLPTIFHDPQNYYLVQK